MATRNSFCSYCGAEFKTETPFPRTCGTCKNVTYVNPIPVAVALLPVGKGLLMIRRNIPPKEGMLALPGGYINTGEAWQVACARELFEETGITITADEIRLFDVYSAPDGTVLIFGIANPIAPESLSALVENDEVSEMVVLNEPAELAFPLHTKVADRFFGVD